MNIQHLRYFIAVAESGSITSAADNLKISQPSLSRQIRIFEEDLGASLFERGARSIELNRRGQEVYDEGRKLIRQIDNSIHRIRKSVEDEVIQISYAPSLGGEILQRAIGSFAQCHPQVRVIMHDSSTEEMRLGMQSKKFDLCIAEPTQESEMEWQQLIQREIALAMPTQHPLLREKPNRRVVKVEELRDQRVLFYSRVDYPLAWENTAGYFITQDVNVKIAGEFDGISSLSLALEAGLGVALVTANSTFSDKVKLLKLKPTPNPVCVSVGWNSAKALDPVKQAFVNELVRAAES